MTQSIFMNLDLSNLIDELQGSCEDIYINSQYEFSTPEGLTILADIYVKVDFSVGECPASYNVDYYYVSVFVDNLYYTLDHNDYEVENYFKTDEAYAIAKLIEDEINLQF